MTVAEFTARVQGRYQRATAGYLFRRSFVGNRQGPLISFSFDDFPRSALFAGGAILKRFGFAGTYYASFGLMGKEAPTGTMFLPEDIRSVVEAGHELGCHTFAHCHSWNTTPRSFEDSIVENGATLKEFLPEARFRTFSYPICPPRPATKQATGKHFVCCRGGGQTFNVGTMDLNYLAAYFLEQARGDLAAVKSLIDRNCQEGGWLVFATHDIAPNPTPYGCTPEFFEHTVQYAANSGARVLPVIEAWESLTG
jgi:peptidoglycan/xylan/chitin deacetylase (PgdA/CDA1 family)